MNTQFKRRRHVYRGRSDKEWGELMKFREEQRQEQQEIAELKSNVHPQLMLKITYDVQHETHSGYCSDPDDNLEIIHRTHTETVGLPVAFKKRDIYYDGMLQSSIQPGNQLLLRLFSKQPESCNRGSGYCGCKTIYSIRTASIFVPINRTQLDTPIELNDIA